MKRSRFNKSFFKLCSQKMGTLTPIGLQLANPGDVMKMQTSCFIRFKPLATPPMHPCHVKIHHWFVPLRLVWQDFEDFITGGEDGLDNSVAPYMAAPASIGYNVGSDADHLGVRPSVPDLVHSALPMRAHASIWNEWYRDSQLQDKLVVSKASGLDTTTYNGSSNLRCAWEKDFFTTARPDPQLGPDVVLPLQNAPVERVSNAPPAKLFLGSANTPAVNASLTATSGFLSGDSANGLSLDPDGGLEADMSTIAPTIRSLRLAAAIQWYQENQNAWGGRYTEWLARNGVKAADARLQRPEYLGGGKQTIQFSEVLQTAPAYVPSDDEPSGVVGDMAGHGVAAARSNSFKYYFQEHGYVISYAIVKPITMYVDGLHKLWSLNTKEDYFQKELARVGMEEILEKQIYAPSATPNAVWGYQDRYDWMRRNESGISGLFRTTYNDWHFARMFSSQPNLDSDFITCIPATRPFADQTDLENVLGMYSHRVQMLSFVPKFGTPKGLTL